MKSAFTVQELVVFFVLIILIGNYFSEIKEWLIIIALISFVAFLLHMYFKNHNNTDEPDNSNLDLHKSGLEYEEKVANFFREHGFEIEERGNILGKLDEGIDLIAIKDNHVLLIQCKNYQPTTKIDHKLVKEFHSNCVTFLNKYKEHFCEEFNIEYYLIFPYKESLTDNGAYAIRNIENMSFYCIE